MPLARAPNWKKQPPVTTPELHRAPLNAPVAAVATDPHGNVVVVADENFPAEYATHVLDYADRLAQLIPEQRHGQH